MITHYEFHELCCIFPRCSDEELQLLVSDIRENGLRTPIARYEGKILDGTIKFLRTSTLGGYDSVPNNRASMCRWSLVVNRST